MDQKVKAATVFLIGIVIFVALFLVATHRPATICNCPNIHANISTTSGLPPCKCPTPIYSTTISNTNSTNTYGPANESVYVQSVEPNANSSTFYCTSNSDCVLVRTSICFNNLPSQQACINQNYENNYNAYYTNFVNGGKMVCPEFMMAGTSSCECINNGCTLVFSKP